MLDTRKFLLFCPDISGHRHLYCKRLIDYLRSRNVAVVVASAGRASSISPWGTIRYASFDGDSSAVFGNHGNVEFIDLKEAQGVAGSLRQLKEVALANGCSDVVHVDADTFRFPLAFSRHLKGDVKHHLILICTEFIDWKRKVGFVRECWRALKALSKGHARGLFLANREYGVEKLPRVSEFLIKRIGKRSAIESVTTTDERLSGLLGGKAHFIPELGTSHWECSDEAAAMDSLSSQVLSEVNAFCSAHAEKRVVCLLGDLESRKGYDLILQLCAAEKDTICVRVGRTKPTYRTTWESIEAKELLIREARIYEFDSYVASWDLFRELMQLQDVVMLPYREFYRTSGVFIDALVAGKPVIVPEEGLMGWRTARYSLGAVFQGGSVEGLRGALNDCTENLDLYSSNAKEYAQKLEKKNFYQLLDTPFQLNNYSTFQR
jgi:glycosyltransferase involved in cell wall biosynthesis